MPEDSAGGANPKKSSGTINDVRERLQKIMARAGLGSRRACEDFITQGRVTVNGQRAELGSQADPAVDDIRVDGERLRLPNEFVYVMLNKPRSVISDEDVAGNWPRARDMIPLEGHLYPVGRLDVQSEGLMLFTNDGDLAHRLTHPSFEHPKTYHALVEGSPGEKTLDAWRRGIPLDDRHTGPAEVHVIGKRREGTMLEITVHEGRKRQLRRIAAKLRHPVLSLVRVRLGPLTLGNLPAGAWRRLTAGEVAALHKIRAGGVRKPRRPMGARPQLDSRRPRTTGTRSNSRNAAAHRRPSRRR